MSMNPTVPKVALIDDVVVRIPASLLGVHTSPPQIASRAWHAILAGLLPSICATDLLTGGVHIVTSGTAAEAGTRLAAVSGKYWHGKVCCQEDYGGLSRCDA